MVIKISSLLNNEKILRIISSLNYEIENKPVWASISQISNRTGIKYSLTAKHLDQLCKIGILRKTSMKFTAPKARLDTKEKITASIFSSESGKTNRNRNGYVVNNNKIEIRFPNLNPDLTYQPVKKRIGSFSFDLSKEFDRLDFRNTINITANSGYLNLLLFLNYIKHKGLEFDNKILNEEYTKLSVIRSLIEYNEIHCRKNIETRRINKSVLFDIRYSPKLSIKSKYDEIIFTFSKHKFQESYQVIGEQYVMD